MNYWYNLEFFQPNWPVKENEDIDLFRKTLPWTQKKSDQEEPNPKFRISYDIYFGCAFADELISWTLDKLDLMEEDTPIERDRSKTCLCALKVNDSGNYVQDSFAISSFAWALSCMVKENDFSVNLDTAVLDKLQTQFNNTLSTVGKEFLLDELTNQFISVSAALGMTDAPYTQSLWARKKLQYKKGGVFPPLEPATELMQSFYTREISMVRKNPGVIVSQYAKALVAGQNDYAKFTDHKENKGYRVHTKHTESEYSGHNNRIMIDRDIYAMQDWLSAERFPKGAWPSPHSPSLMQQLAINISISRQNIFSVNGPPGTGKTTLLKEVVASGVAQRAALMAAYSNPDDAFQERKFVSPPSEFNTVFYQPNDKLTAYSMLVASNNNAAVENISIELPKAISEDRTSRFLSNDDLSETYFSDIATELINEKAWGLISARLGKRDNLKKLKERLWWAKDEITLKNYYEKTAPDWNTARKNFFSALEAVEREQKRIAQVQQMPEQYASLLKTETYEASRLAQSQTSIAELRKQYDEQTVLLKHIEDSHALQQQNAAALKAGISFTKRLLPSLSKRDPVVREWKQVEHDCAESLISITRQRTALHSLEQELEAAIQNAEKQKITLQKAVEYRLGFETALQSEKERFGSNFPDVDFWKDIYANEKSQAACPWTNKHYDALREELFYQSLMLHKAFVLGSKYVRKNLMCLFDMWDGNFTNGDRKIAYGSLLNTLFFVIPVISTTFASVHSFLDCINQGELGILVIDESGQATPQSALGALWRTQSAVIVGDPLQVEPILTTPLELCKRFAEDAALPSHYRIPELSVQMLADAQNPYGGEREINAEKIWLGCPLVVHRRCINPMFDISNRVAYNGRMFCKTNDSSAEKNLLLPASCWFDVEGNENGNKDHTVPAQINLVVNLIEKAFKQFDGLPDIYIITPFTSVKNSLTRDLRKMLRRYLPETANADIDEWLSENCGTIHTFQGKEANEVLIVLGCDRQQGMGAAGWVGQKPNIINVAVSRAKFRVGLIGSYELWNSIPYVQTVCDVLRKAVIRDPALLFKQTSGDTTDNLTGGEL